MSVFNPSRKRNTTIKLILICRPLQLELTLYGFKLLR